MSKPTEHQLPADPEGQNDARAEYAMGAVRTFQKTTGLTRHDGLDTGDDESRSVMIVGNVDTEILDRLGFDYSDAIPSKPKVKGCDLSGGHEDCTNPECPVHGAVVKCWHEARNAYAAMPRWLQVADNGAALRAEEKRLYAILTQEAK